MARSGHHGGAGTTGASVRGEVLCTCKAFGHLTQSPSAGIPTIIKPFFGDQFFWGGRVEALGIGSCVRKLTVDNLAEALRLATTDPKRIERAKLVGEKIRAVSCGFLCMFLCGASERGMLCTGEWREKRYRGYLSRS